MFYGDKGSPSRFKTMRYNYDVLVDDEKMTLSKLARKLNFYSIVFDSKINDTETVYDTENNLLTTTGLIIRKRRSLNRTYFSLVRLNSVKTTRNHERKEFLGECDKNDRPSDFPVQIANRINEIFGNVFTVNLVDIIKHCTPYIATEISGNKYKIICGTGYEAELSFETFKVRNFRNGKTAKLKNFSLAFELDPDHEREREEILDTIDRYCKELVLLDRNNFEISEVSVKTRIPKDIENKEEIQGRGRKKKKKEKEGE